ncbi:hypothetical protein PWEIH_06721 [Listeria weihenstephanensis FSL R9-0317]|uniref:Uncharacterized protein n=1 Tax=Listeria weihenstephanensis TaxID=1006155 RepID=A0A1S7FQP1_9LIST|nr:hypothetical protein [Listeria weihenstephanensis]AQY49665.1 hypothetical protein UE46_00345 [Listeria weihenstephanensis]EUJ39592.1 hypothetical protein PWEIH_06721 [Listeria weihenstephanensis FSL R9-0317]
MKITENVLLENEFYLYSENGGGPATYTIKNGTIEILHGDLLLEFPYTYSQPTFTICKAILTEGGEVFLIVSDWLDDEGLYILSFSDSASSYALVGEGLTGFLVIGGLAYLLYHEEGVYHTHSDSQLNGYSMYALLKWEPIQNEMVRVLPDEFLPIDDANSFCYDGKANLYVFYYGEMGEGYGNFCLKYNLATNQGEYYTIPTYYEGSYYYDNRCYGFDGKGIMEFNSKMEPVNYTALDMSGMNDIIGGYQELVIIEEDKSYFVYK